MTIKEAIKHLKGYDPKSHCAMHLWLTDDVFDKAKEMGVDMDQDKADEIIDDVHNHIDCTLGITWDTIECYIDNVTSYHAVLEKNKTT